MFQQYLFVAVGGTLGVLARYSLQSVLYGFGGRGFPYATMVINIVGCLVIGIVISLADERGMISAQWRALLTTGFCGGFTTFSTFSYETISLFRDGEYLYAAVYSGGSVLLGIGATIVGLIIGRAL